jgi:hypothetical protein
MTVQLTRQRNLVISADLVGQSRYGADKLVTEFSEVFALNNNISILTIDEILVTEIGTATHTR